MSHRAPFPSVTSELNGGCKIVGGSFSSLRKYMGK